MNQINEFGQSLGETLSDWVPCAYPARVSLQGRLCRLEPLSASHASALYQAHQRAPDNRSWTWLTREPENSLEDYTQWVNKAILLNDPIHFAVIDQKTNMPIGSLALMRIDPSNGVVEVGHVHFSSLLSGTTMSTEAHWLLMYYAFETLGYRRYEWKCNSLNEPSHNAALRLGFQYEGCFRQAMVVKGHSRDTQWFSIIDKEWPQIGRSLECWLAPENFDAEGKQIRSLAAIRQDESNAS